MRDRLQNGQQRHRSDLQYLSRTCCCWLTCGEWWWHGVRSRSRVYKALVERPTARLQTSRPWRVRLWIILLHSYYFVVRPTFLLIQGTQRSPSPPQWLFGLFHKPRLFAFSPKFTLLLQGHLFIFSNFVTFSKFKTILIN